jgi:hypothetical protein
MVHNIRNNSEWEQGKAPNPSRWREREEEEEVFE